MGAKGKALEVEIEGRFLKLTNLDKVLFPKAGFTKAHVIDYYRRIAPVLLPHLQGRAVTMKRYPDGVDGPFFYEKNAPSYRPEWLTTAPIHSESRGEDIEYCVFDDLPSLIWAANLADLEMHTFLAKADEPTRPTSMVFDLDPGPGTDVIDCCDVALLLRDLLQELDLQSLVKTSGSKGMQLYVPLNTPTTYEDTKPLSRAMGELIERQAPAKVTTNMSKAERPGKVFIDWSQNDFHKTTVCVYSLRAKDEPTVSTPLAWQEVEQATKHRDASKLTFVTEDTLARVERHGDLFAPLLDLQQSLPALA